MRANFSRPIARSCGRTISAAPLGGPVYIPKLYDGRNKAFFFFSYEKVDLPSGSPSGFTSVPPEALRNGDFSQWKDAHGNVIPIYDPATTRVVGESDRAGAVSRQQNSGRPYLADGRDHQQILSAHRIADVIQQYPHGGQPRQRTRMYGRSRAITLSLRTVGSAGCSAGSFSARRSRSAPFRGRWRRTSTAPAQASFTA